jgi:hypothetical protein
MMSGQDKQQRNIKDLADNARRRGRDYYGDAAWAKMCLEFDDQFAGGANIYVRYVAVMRMLAEYQSPVNMQLGCVWLDGHGYGDRSVEWLAGELARIRMQGMK